MDTYKYEHHASIILIASSSIPSIVVVKPKRWNTEVRKANKQLRRNGRHTPFKILRDPPPQLLQILPQLTFIRSVGAGIEAHALDMKTEILAITARLRLDLQRKGSSDLVIDMKGAC